MRAICGGLFVFAIASTARAEDHAEMKSPAMVASGVATATVGSGALAGGIFFLTLYANEITTTASACPSCHPTTVPRDSDYLVGGTIALVTGVLALTASIPLVYIGAKHRSPVWITAGGIAGRF